ncbi:hypothetical protein LP416_08030 [Polaromonas sp. P2-4]|nr:hypothetical protein LP416_08030 [Polaromonas sp. P2-4]
MPTSEAPRVEWTVRNQGTIATDINRWVDQVYLSTSPTMGAGAVLIGSLTHVGPLAVGSSYSAAFDMILPRTVGVGYMYFIVKTDAFGNVFERSNTGNNTAVAATSTQILAELAADLTVSNVTGPTSVRPNDPVTITYTAGNNGTAAAIGPWRDRIYVDRGINGLTEVASIFNSDRLEIGASVTRTVNFTLPYWFYEGDFTWVVRTDADNTVSELAGESNNQVVSAAGVHVARPDLQLSNVQGTSLVQSGAQVQVDWTVTNIGNQVGSNWTDQVYLSKAGVSRLMATVPRNGGLATGASYAASVDFTVPLDFSGEYELLVITDSGNAIDDHSRTDNRVSRNVTVNLSPYADLTVSGRDGTGPRH